MREPTVHPHGETEKKIDIILQGVFASGFSLHPDAQPAVHIGGKDFYKDGIVEDPQNPGKYFIALVTKDGKILQGEKDGIPFAKVISGPIETSVGTLVQLRKTPKIVPASKGWTPKMKIDAWYSVESGVEVDISAIVSELGSEVNAYTSYSDEKASWGESSEVGNGVWHTAVGEIRKENGGFKRGVDSFTVTQGVNTKIYVQGIHKNFTIPGIGEVTQFSGARNGGGFGRQMFFDVEGKQVRFEVGGASRYMTGVLFVGKHGTLIGLEGEFEVFLPYNAGTTHAIAGNSVDVNNVLNGNK